MFEKIRDIICTQLGIPAESVEPESDFVLDLACDSLDVVEIIMAVEEEFEIEIPEEDLEDKKTVGSLADYVAKKVSE